MKEVKSEFTGWGGVWGVRVGVHVTGDGWRDTRDQFPTPRREQRGTKKKVAIEG